MNNILKLSEWINFIQDFLLDEEKATPFTEGLEYLFSNCILRIVDILSIYELSKDSIMNKNQFIDFVINLIDSQNSLLYFCEYNYLNNILKYFLDFLRNHDDLDDFINLQSYLYEHQLNDFIFLINKYNQWLDQKHYEENITFREEILVEDYKYLLENWIEWFNIRYRMNNVFINNNYTDWYIFSNYLTVL